MIAAGVKGLQGDAIQWAAYTKNRIPHEALKGSSPIATLLNILVQKSNLRPFGQEVIIHMQKDQRKDKMTPLVIKGCIVGYTATHGIYQVITNTGKR